MRNLFLLSNASVIPCKNCGAELKPQKMGTWYFALAFVATAVPGQYFARYYHSLPRGLVAGFFFGFVVYALCLGHTFLTVKFQEV